VMPAPPDEPPPRDVLTFARNGPLRRSSANRRLLTWARHIILCVEDAFPSGTVQSLEAAEAGACFGVIDAALDVGQGYPHLRFSVREDLEAQFIHSRGPDYEVITFHIAPTHAHVLIRQNDDFPLELTVDRWKKMAFAYSGHSPALAQRIWAPGYYDTVLTDADDIEAARVAIDSHEHPPQTGEDEG
jgi:hypothetical protein